MSRQGFGRRQLWPILRYTYHHPHCRTKWIHETLPYHIRGLNTSQDMVVCWINTLQTDDRLSIPKYTQGARTEHSKCSTWRNIPSPVTMPYTTNNMQYQLVSLCTSSGSCTDSTCQKRKNSYYHIFKFLLCVSILVFNSHCWEGTWAIKLPKSVKSLLEIPKDDLDWDLLVTFWSNVC